MSDPRAELFESLIQVTASEVKRNNPQLQFDVSSYKVKIDEIIQQTCRQLGEQNVQKIVTAVNNQALLSHIIQICMQQMQNITRDGKIDLDDTSYFLDAIRQIYEEIDAARQQPQTALDVKITTTDLMTMAGFLLKLVLTYTIKDPQALDSSLRICHSAILLATFSLTPVTFSWKWKCC